MSNGSPFAPNLGVSIQRQESDRLYNRAQRQYGASQAQSRIQQSNIAEKEKWMKIKDTVVKVGGKLQDTVKKQVASNIMKYSIPQGKFVIQDEEVKWKWNDNATMKKIPTMDELYEVYKRPLILSGQMPDFGEFYYHYNNINAGYAQAMDQKFKSLEGLGFNVEDVSSALIDSDLVSNLSQVSGSSVQGPKGQMIQAGAGIGPYLKEIVGKKDKGFFREAREKFWSPLGMDTFKGGGLVGGGYVAGKKAKEVIPRVATKVKGKVSEKLAARQIAKSGLAKTRTPQKLVTDLAKYLQRNSSDDLIKLLARKGFAKQAATKMATRIAAVSAAATLGTATAPSGIGAVAGYGMAAWGLYDMWTILEDIAPLIEENLYGNTPKAEF